MLLSNYLLSGGVKPYLEYGWVCAPNTAGQAITANTITTLTIDTEVADTGNNGSIFGNQITLNSGTYYYEIYVPLTSVNSNYNALIVGLRKNPSTSPEFISRKGFQGYANTFPDKTLSGQFTINTSTVFDITAITTWDVGSSVIRTTAALTPFTLSTAGTDQRTTIKLWKLA
jgi:hypothetical protein